MEEGQEITIHTGPYQKLYKRAWINVAKGEGGFTPHKVHIIIQLRSDETKIPAMLSQTSIKKKVQQENPRSRTEAIFQKNDDLDNTMTKLCTELAKFRLTQKDTEDLKDFFQISLADEVHKLKKLQAKGKARYRHVDFKSSTANNRRSRSRARDTDMESTTRSTRSSHTVHA
jgi:hypothetical protein